MFNAADYRPDPLVTAGASWARRLGIPNHNISTQPVGAGEARHVHVVNHMFDHPTLVAVVVPGGPGYQAKVVPGATCAACAAAGHGGTPRTD